MKICIIKLGLVYKVLRGAEVPELEKWYEGEPYEYWSINNETHEDRFLIEFCADIVKEISELKKLKEYEYMIFDLVPT